MSGNWTSLLSVLYCGLITIPNCRSQQLSLPGWAQLGRHKVRSIHPQFHCFWMFASLWIFSVHRRYSVTAPHSDTEQIVFGRCNTLGKHVGTIAITPPFGDSVLTDKVVKKKLRHHKCFVWLIQVWVDHIRTLLSEIFRRQSIDDWSESKSASYIIELAAGAGRKVHTECEYNYVGFRNANEVAGTNTGISVFCMYIHISDKYRRNYVPWNVVRM